MKPDPLVKAAARMDAEKKAAECMHHHMLFGRQGFDLTCIDCGRRYVTTMTGYDIPEFTYSHPKLNEFEYRHSTHEGVRVQPLKAPEPVKREIR